GSVVEPPRAECIRAADGQQLAWAVHDGVGRGEPSEQVVGEGDLLVRRACGELLFDYPGHVAREDSGYLRVVDVATLRHEVGKSRQSLLEPRREQLLVQALVHRASWPPT